MRRVHLVGVGGELARLLAERALANGWGLPREGLPAAPNDLIVMRRGARPSRDLMAVAPQRSILLDSGPEPGASTAMRSRTPDSVVLNAGLAPNAIARDFEFMLDEDAWAPVPGIEGSSLTVRRLRAAIARAARSDSTVLLTGETGTGKTVAARALHLLSRAPSLPFVHVDCAALSTSLLESELFGHERGAFTGAQSRRQGRFEVAGHGTILLDEIAELDPRLQAKFLRVLEQREYERVGGARPVALHARVLAATNVSLAEAVAERRFRRDLLYRLEVVSIELPSLDARRSDIPELARGALARVARRLGVDAFELDASCCERLLAARWPGNIRQLQNVLESMLVNARGGRLDESILDSLEQQARGRAASTRATPAGSNAVHERAHVAEVLVASGGNIARAARRLGIPRSTAQYRIERLGLRHLIPVD